MKPYLLSRHPFLRIAASMLVVFSSVQAQSYRFSCPAYGGGYLPVVWQPTYSAYIPASYIPGPTPCFSFLYGSTTKLYKGDGNADIGDGWPVQSARVYGSVFFRGSFNNGVQNAPSY